MSGRATRIDGGEPVEASVTEKPCGCAVGMMRPAPRQIRGQASRHGKAVAPTNSAVTKARAIRTHAIELGHDDDGETAASQAQPAIESLGERRAARLSDIRTAGDEGEAGADAHERADGDNQAGRRRREGGGVGDREHGNAGQGRAPAPKCSLAFPAGICIAMCARKRAVVNSPTSASEMP